MKNAKKSKVKKKATAKKTPAKATKHELVVRVAAQPMEPAIPSATDLAEPIRDGRSLTIPKTWLSEKQITRLVERTPAKYVYQRPAKGGGKWDYVTVSYVQRVLDYVFGFNWDFEIVEHGKEADHVWVLGRLTVKNPQGTMQVVKTQFGRSEVKKQKSGGNLDYGNDLKSAASDALKKCASMLGIARDIYGKTDYREESGNEPRQEAMASDAPKVYAPAEPQKAEGPIEDFVCSWSGKGGCGADLTRQEATYSKKVYGRMLCREHQKAAKPK